MASSTGSTADIPKLTVVRADDWEALYADGKCVAQNHSIDWRFELQELGFDIQTVWAEGQADELGQFPDALEDVRPDA